MIFVFTSFDDEEILLEEIVVKLVFLVEYMLEEMPDVSHYSRIDEISLVIVLGHEGSYNTKSEAFIVLIESMYQHASCTALAIGTCDGDGHEVFADLGDHLVVGDADMEVFLGRCLLIQTRLADFGSRYDGRDIRIDHEVI